MGTQPRGRPSPIRIRGRISAAFVEGDGHSTRRGYACKSGRPERDRLLTLPAGHTDPQEYRYVLCACSLSMRRLTVAETRETGPSFSSSRFPSRLSCSLVFGSRSTRRAGSPGLPIRAESQAIAQLTAIGPGGAVFLAGQREKRPLSSQRNPATKDVVIAPSGRQFSAAANTTSTADGFST